MKATVGESHRTKSNDEAGDWNSREEKQSCPKGSLANCCSLETFASPFVRYHFSSICQFSFIISEVGSYIFQFCESAGSDCLYLNLSNNWHVVNI